MSTEPQPTTARHLACRLLPGDNLVAGLRAVFDAADTQAMALVTCVGSLQRVELRHADRDRATVYEGRFEILSLVGTLDARGQHLHLSIADGDGAVFGGHLMPEGSEIYTTAEIVVAALDDLQFDRQPCPLSGYRELTITPRRS